MKRIALISCSGDKLGRMAPARQLYRSQLFRKSVAWVEQQGLQWLVISAKYGLIRPDEVLMPYDYSAGQMTPRERESWNTIVAQQLDAHFSDEESLEVVLLAGEKYAGWIPLVASFAKVEQPMQGMQIGQRLQWLTAQVETRPADYQEQEVLL